MMTYGRHTYTSGSREHTRRGEATNERERQSEYGCRITLDWDPAGGDAAIGGSPENSELARRIARANALWDAAIATHGARAQRQPRTLPPVVESVRLYDAAWRRLRAARLRLAAVA